MKIFIVEDDALVRTELAKLLSSYGYECDYSDDFENILPHIEQSGADLILLDINLPYYDGLHICSHIRERFETPIIIVTSSSSQSDEIMGMNLGADDFVTKPYNKQVLLARIAAVLKRANPKNVGETLSHGGITVSIVKSCVTHGETTQDLTKNELHILTLLIKNKGKIVSREELMEELWQSDEFVDDNTLTVNINRLRRKLCDIGAENYIVTKRGQGYIV